jgi:drug/metabolite transporter (DMT)-like permease
MLGGSTLFAVMATFVGLAQRRDPALSTFVASGVRAGVNLVVILLLGARDPRGLVGDGRWALWSRGLFGGVSLMAYFASLAALGIGEASFLNQTSGAWVAVLAPLILFERTPPLVWLAVGGSLLGTAFLAHPRAGGGDLLGRGAGLLSGLTSAAAYLSIRRASATNKPITIVFYFTLVGTILSLAVCFLVGATWPRDPAVYLFLTGSGLCATVAQLLMTEAYRSGRASPVAAAGASGPLLTSLLGWAVLDQVPDGSGHRHGGPARQRHRAPLPRRAGPAPSAGAAVILALLLACHGGDGGTRSLRVHVTLDGAPAAGVAVRQGGNPQRWTTDEQGDTTVLVDLGVKGETYVMASSEEARIAGDFVTPATAEPLTLALRRFDRSDNPAYVFQDPGDGDPATSSSDTCQHCHGQLHAQWFASPHRTSASDPALQDLYQGMAAALSEPDCVASGGSWEETVTPGTAGTAERCVKGAGVLGSTNGYGGCADCHAPGIDGVLGGRDLLDATGVAYAFGVHCDVCHKVEAVDLAAAPGVAGALRIVRPAEPSDSPVLGDWDPLTFGPWDDVPNPRMGAVHRGFFQDSTMCAGCHEEAQPVLVAGATLDRARWPGGTLPIHTTWSEWKGSAFDPVAPCQSCHMPPDPVLLSGADLGVDADAVDTVGIASGWERPKGAVRTHTWYGPRQAAGGLLATAATVDLVVRIVDGEVVADVTVANTGAGHALPTGDPMRAVLLTVAARCDGVPLRPTGGDVLPEWAGWRDRQAAGTRWPGAAVGDVLRVVRRTGAWLDAPGFGPFGDGTFDPARKGLAEEVAVGEVTVTGVTGDGVTLSGPLPKGDVVYRGGGQALAGAPGFAFARVLADASGNRMVPHFLAVDVVRDNRLPPQARWTSHHRFATTCVAPKVTATLLHRDHPWALATERGWPVTDQVMATVTRAP